MNISSLPIKLKKNIDEVDLDKGEYNDFAIFGKKEINGFQMYGWILEGCPRI